MKTHSSGQTTRAFLGRTGMWLKVASAALLLAFPCCDRVRAAQSSGSLDALWAFGGGGTTNGLSNDFGSKMVRDHQGNLLVAWPASAAGFTLQTTDQMVPVPHWAVSNASVTVAGDQKLLLIDPRGSARFYRLSKP